MQYKHSTSQGYSIIASIMMIGFLLVLTTSTLNLVLQEMKDGQGRQQYLKAFSAAESSLELALLKIRQYGYGYDDDNFTDKDILGSGALDPRIGYEFENKTSSFSGSILPYETIFIPLFWINNIGDIDSVSNLSLSSTSSDIIWNIIGTSQGMSGRGGFSNSTLSETKGVSDDGGNKVLGASSTNIGSFLGSNPGSYLALYNPTSGNISYDITSGDSFSRPITKIISSGKVGKYSQNLSTDVNNTKFLGILKYSIYSGD